MAEQKNILIIEDNDNFRQHVTEILTQQGYNVIQAKDGEEGWKHVSTGTIDLVILDMVMPGKNGRWFVDTVRSSQDHKHLPIIIFTNLSHGENIGKVIVKGISRMLVKEHTSDTELSQTVNDVIEGKA